MSSRSRSIAARAALAVMLAAPAAQAQTLGAQPPASTDSAAVSLVAAPAAERAASVDSLRAVGGAPMVGVAVRAPAREQAAAPTMAAPGALRQSQVLMIVGGAAVVLGLVAGGDAEAPLVVGGAIIGLFGLYQYLR